MTWYDLHSYTNMVSFMPANICIYHIPGIYSQENSSYWLSKQINIRPGLKNNIVIFSFKRTSQHFKLISDRTKSRLNGDQWNERQTINKLLFNVHYITEKSFATINIVIQTHFVWPNVPKPATLHLG